MLASPTISDFPVFVPSVGAADHLVVTSPVFAEKEGEKSHIYQVQMYNNNVMDIARLHTDPKKNHIM